MTAASSGSAHKSAPTPPNRSQRLPDRPREGKSKRTLIESACTACQKRKSRVSSSPFYSLPNANLVNIHMLTIFPSATGSGRYLVTKSRVLSDPVLTPNSQTGMLSLPSTTHRLRLQCRRRRESMVSSTSEDTHAREGARRGARYITPVTVEA
jgi:hypothetical protein